MRRIRGGCCTGTLLITSINGARCWCCALLITLINILTFRELEARLEKQRATREYVQEFIKKKEEVEFLYTSTLRIHITICDSNVLVH